MNEEINSVHSSTSPGANQPPESLSPEIRALQRLQNLGEEQIYNTPIQQLLDNARKREQALQQLVRAEQEIFAFAGSPDDNRKLDEVEQQVGAALELLQKIEYPGEDGLAFRRQVLAADIARANAIKRTIEQWRGLLKRQHALEDSLKSVEEAGRDYHQTMQSLLQDFQRTIGRDIGEQKRIIEDHFRTAREGLDQREEQLRVHLESMQKKAEKNHTILEKWQKFIGHVYASLDAMFKDLELKPEFIAELKSSIGDFNDEYWHGIAKRVVQQVRHISEQTRQARAEMQRSEQEAETRRLALEKWREFEKDASHLLKLLYQPEPQLGDAVPLKEKLEAKIDDLETPWRNAARQVLVQIAQAFEQTQQIQKWQELLGLVQSFDQVILGVSVGRSLLEATTVIRDAKALSDSWPEKDSLLKMEARSTVKEMIQRLKQAQQKHFHIQIQQVSYWLKGAEQYLPLSSRAHKATFFKSPSDNNASSPDPFAALGCLARAKILLNDLQKELEKAGSGRSVPPEIISELKHELEEQISHFGELQKRTQDYLPRQLFRSREEQREQAVRQLQQVIDKSGQPIEETRDKFLEGQEHCELVDQVRYYLYLDPKIEPEDQLKKLVLARQNRQIQANQLFYEVEIHWTDGDEQSRYPNLDRVWQQIERAHRLDPTHAGIDQMCREIKRIYDWDQEAQSLANQLEQEGPDTLKPETIEETREFIKNPALWSPIRNRIREALEKRAEHKNDSFKEPSHAIECVEILNRLYQPEVPTHVGA